MNESKVALAACSSERVLPHLELTSSTITQLQQYSHINSTVVPTCRMVVTYLDHTKFEYLRNDCIEEIGACTVITKQCILK